MLRSQNYSVWYSTELLNAENDVIYMTLRNAVNMR